MSTWWRLTGLAVLVFFVVPLSAWAVPPTISYQGYLTEDDGTPIHGTADLGFAIYASPTGGTELWSETHAAAPVEEGIFHVALGGVVALDPALFDGGTFWIETRVDAVPLVPRRPFQSVPYAFRAQVADYAVGGGDGDDDWVVSGNNVYRVLGNVGVGNVLPQDRLHVTDATFARLRLERTGGATVSTDASLTTGSVGTTSAHPFRLISSNSVRVSIDTGGNVGIGTTTPSQTLQVNGTTSRAIYGLQTGTSGSLIGVFGESNSINGTGVRGVANHATGLNAGLHGQTLSSNGDGVLGEGGLYGVRGRTSSAGFGVAGYADGSSGVNYGVYGRSNSATGYGVFGYNFGGGEAGYFDGNATVKGRHRVTNGAITTDLSPTILSATSDFTVDSNAALALESTGDLSLDAGAAALLTSVGTWTAESGLGMALTSSSSLVASSQSALTVDAGTTLVLDSNVSSSLTSSGTVTVTGTFVRMNGNVGLGLTPGFRLHLVNDSAAKPTSNTWTISSDRRLKKNIQPLHGSLDRLLRLQGVTYQWRNPETQGGMTGVYPGFIAQDVAPVFPDWIREDPEGYKTLTVIGFEALAVEAMRELRAESEAALAELRTEMEVLRVEKNMEVAALREQVDQLQSRLARFETLEERLARVETANHAAQVSR